MQGSPSPLRPHPLTFTNNSREYFSKLMAVSNPRTETRLADFSTQLTNPLSGPSPTAGLPDCSGAGTGPTRPRPRALVFTFSQRLPFESPIKGCFYWKTLASSEACSTLGQLDSFFGRVLSSSAAVCSSREETRFISSRSHRRSSRRTPPPPPPSPKDHHSFFEWCSDTG